MRHGIGIACLLCLPTTALAQGLNGGPQVTNYGQGVANRGDAVTVDEEPEPAPVPGNHQLGPVLHPDVEFQRQLRAETLRLKQEGLPGVELWTAVMKMAVDHHADREDLTVAERYDAIMRDTGAVLVGEATMRARFRQLRGADALPVIWITSARNPLIDTFLADYDLMDDGLFAGGGLDATPGSDFRPEFRDGTNNQIYHSYFYVQLAYVIDDPETVSRGNLYHELFDGGRSHEDYDVGNWGAVLGTYLRRMRDGDDPRALHAIPTLIGAVFGDDPSAYGHPDDNGGRDYRTLARNLHGHVSQHVHNPSGELLPAISNSVRRGMITVFTFGGLKR